MPAKSTDLNRYVIWIDPHKALLGQFDAEDQFTCNTLKSGLGRRPHADEEITFCKQVIERLEHPSSLWILGPGHMKYVLENEISVLTKFQTLWFESQEADRMNVLELAEAGRRHYHILTPLHIVK